MKRLLATSLGWLLLCQGVGVRAEEISWRPTGSLTASNASTSGQPIVVVGRPIPLENGPGAPAESPGKISQAGWSAGNDGTPRMIVRAQSGDLPPPPPPPDAGLPTPGLNDPYNCAQATQNPGPGRPFLDNVKQVFNGDLFKSGSGSRTPFQSDHKFDNFISPVTSSFMFLDPRSLTEIKPIFLYQGAPDKNYLVKGADIEFFGIQGSLALTDCWSIVLNKYGYMAIETGSGAPQRDAYGFTELHIGPKYTFLRDDKTATVGAAGLTFQLPVGASGVFQDTGNLSLVPYLSMAHNFIKTGIGSINGMGTMGYSLGMDNQRSDFFFLSLHLDLNISDANKIYPLIELNWFQYTEGGTARSVGFEGRDLANLGSAHVGGDDSSFTLAVGGRYKFSECVQAGAAVELPLNGRHDLLDFRLTFDMIFRY